MRALFVKADCLLYDRQQASSHDPAAEWSTEAMAGLRAAAETGLLTVVIDPNSGDGAARAGRGTAEEMASQLRATIGGAQSAYPVLRCPHSPEEDCNCWGPEPRLLHEAAVQFDLRLGECYLVCDDLDDVASAYAVGCRPFLVLEGRTISELCGESEPPHKDYPIARTLGAALQYVIHEDQLARELGPYFRAAAISQHEEHVVPPPPGQVRDPARLWPVLTVRVVWLSLGIAYLLTHLYRVQPFPAFVWYLTLQFIPRPLRGLLFLGSGTLVAVIAFRHLLPGAMFNSRARRKARKAS